jgi:hypothetical protein
MGVQEEPSQPVAVLPSEGPETLAIASAAGFRCFTDTKAFNRDVRREVLAADGALSRRSDQAPPPVGGGLPID